MPARPPIRRALSNRNLVRISLSYAAAATGEWALWVGVLVYAYEQRGTTTAGLASLALLAPAAVVALAGASAADGPRPNHVLCSTFTAQAALLGATAALAGAGAHPWFVIGLASAAVSLISLVRPCYAVVVPGVVRSAAELTVANLFTGWGDSVCVLLGPLLASSLIAARSPTLVFILCAAIAAAGAAATLPLLADDQPAPKRSAVTSTAVSTTTTTRHSVRTLAAALREMRRRPGTTSVLAVLGAQFVLIGALDLLYVILAVETLDLEPSGAGLLGAMFGAGAIVGGLATMRLVARARLAPLIVGSLVSFSVGLVVFGAAAALATALIVLPVLGLCRSLLDVTGRMLLQRSAPVGALASVFALVEILTGVGCALGSGLAQVLVAIWSPEAALVGLGAVFALLLALTVRQLLHADESADVPIVAIRLLRNLPVFAPLAPPALEGVARAAEEIEVPAGHAVITEGEAGDRFYAVADGELEVTIHGEPIRRVTRGGCFGEVALLIDTPRTATITALEPSCLLALDRVPFLVAVTGSASSHQAAWGVMRGLEYGSTRHPLLQQDSPPAAPTEAPPADGSVTDGPHH